MHIKTERGWMPLQTSTKPIPEAPPRYRGPLPSRECLAYIAGLDNAHVEWVERRKTMQEGQG